jgi:glycosyltransferase involved in cell wall biosynthesis
VKISIIITVYNVKDYLRRCLDSVIAQTYTNLEIIISESRSTDGSKEICDEYAKKDPRIKVIHDESRDVVEARNSGLSIVTGDLIGFVDGDDYIEAEMYELLLQAITEHQAQVAVCYYRCLGEGERHCSYELKEPSESKETYLLSRVEALDAYVCEDEKIRISNTVWSKLFTREAVYGFSFDHVKYAEELMYITRAFCQSEKIVYLDRILYNYTVDRIGSGMNRKAAEDYLNVDVRVYKEQIAFLQARGLHESSQKAAYYFYRRTLFWFIDFKKEKHRRLVKRLVEMWREEAQEIRSCYRHPWVKRGDKVRMQVFLLWPGLYYFLDKCYNRYVIPRRQKTAKNLT